MIQGTINIILQIFWAKPTPSIGDPSATASAFIVPLNSILSSFLGLEYFLDDADLRLKSRLTRLGRLFHQWIILFAPSPKYLCSDRLSYIPAFLTFSLYLVFLCRHDLCGSELFTTSTHQLLRRFCASFLQDFMYCLR